MPAFFGARRLAAYTPPPVATPWTPLSSATLAEWLDTTSGIVLAGSNNVQSYTGRKGTVFSQSTAAARPGVTTINGVRALTATGSQSLLGSGLPSATFPGTFAAVVSVADTAARTIIGSTADGGVQFRIANLQPDIVKQNQQDLGSSSAISASTLAIVLVTYTSSNLVFRNNGSSAGSSNYTIPDGFTSSNSVLLVNGSNMGENFSGTLGDLVKDGGTTLALQQKLEGFLAWKFGLASLLPAGHPYKSRAPLTSDP